jgi:alkanesulfonate monooxygenase SsuD/methylene tetrahydromethanopterin reductase-like flavin-dependent oxidoreductase (luciferase family)
MGIVLPCFAVATTGVVGQQPRVLGAAPVEATTQPCDKAGLQGPELPMKFGLFGGAKSGGQASSDSQNYGKFIDYVLCAEELGYESLFVVEHHFTGNSQVSASLNLLSFIAGRTQRMRLGTAVVVLPWHNPVLLAEQVATLDLLSSGRFDFGVGKGYRDNEFESFCIPKAEATERFDECMDILRKAWTTSGRFTHQGKHWNFRDIVVEPRPVQQPHPPFWMGAGSPEGIRRAGREGFNLLLDQIAPIELTIERVATYRDEIEQQGQSFDGMRVGVTRAVQVVRNDEERRNAFAARRRTLAAIGALARGPGAERYQNAQSFADADLAAENAALIGTPEEIIGQLHQLADGGVEYILLIDSTGSTDTLRTFASEIMPEFAQA